MPKIQLNVNSDIKLTSLYIKILVYRNGAQKRNFSVRAKDEMS